MLKGGWWRWEMGDGRRRTEGRAEGKAEKLKTEMLKAEGTNSKAEGRWEREDWRWKHGPCVPTAIYYLPAPELLSPTSAPADVISELRVPALRTCQHKWLSQYYRYESL
jgi:hypothetical protein